MKCRGDTGRAVGQHSTIDIPGNPDGQAGSKRCHNSHVAALLLRLIASVEKSLDSCLPNCDFVSLSKKEMHLRVITFALIWLLPVDARNLDGSDSHYDFVIVGGGTSGLVVANRLSELGDVSVAVIEAGDSVLNNHNVSTTTGYGLSFGTAIDWAYQTEDQIYAGGSKQTMRAGKAIGGTSTINGIISKIPPSM